MATGQSSPPGLYCDTCQNVFGSSIEQQALSNYPFSLLRVFLSVPTKKGRLPWLQSWEGRIQASGVLGTIGYDPATIFKEATENGGKTQLRIPAEPVKPAMVCRTLIKMGLEVVAADNPDDVFSGRFDAARNYALLGKKECPWWYLQSEDMGRISRMVTGRPINDDLDGRVELETCDIGDGAEVFHLRLYYLDMICPLEARIMPPPMNDLAAPQHRLFVV